MIDDCKKNKIKFSSDLKKQKLDFNIKLIQYGVKYIPSVYFRLKCLDFVYFSCIRYACTSLSFA